jgi:hypothetical protein
VYVNTGQGAQSIASSTGPSINAQIRSLERTAQQQQQQQFGCSKPQRID